MFEWLGNVADDTRERVLHAAGPIFAQKGFESATVREICATAGVNVSSVNYHFGDKQTLYIETIRLAHTLRVLDVSPPTWPVDTTAREKLTIFVHNLLARVIGTDELNWHTRILMREMLEPTAACRPIVEDFVRPQHNRLLAIIGELAPDTHAQHREKIAFSIVGQCLHYRFAREFVAILVSTADRERHFQLEQLAEHITEFSLAALSALSDTQPATTAAHQPAPSND